MPTSAILEALRAAGVRVTFFLTGRWVTENPDLAREIAAEHEIANHSFSHPDFAELDDAQILDQMQRAEAVIEQVTGRGTKPFWRAPYGSRNARILGVMAAAGWTIHVLWSADALDWQEIAPEQVRANVNAAAHNGAIILQHCGSTQTATVIADELRDLRGRGFSIVTISELVRGRPS
jgi:peptidoglycan/xylan/chitin deacetylase (PgdA/CDA1 family)